MTEVILTPQFKPQPTFDETLWKSYEYLKQLLAQNWSALNKFLDKLFFAVERDKDIVTYDTKHEAVGALLDDGFEEVPETDGADYQNPITGEGAAIQWVGDEDEGEEGATAVHFFPEETVAE